MVQITTFVVPIFLLNSYVSAQNDIGNSNDVISSVQHNCAAQCGIGFGKDLQKYVSPDTARKLLYLSLDAIYEVYTDPSKYKGFCRGFTTFKLCVENCTPSFFKTIARAGAKVIDYSCIDRRDDILRYFPCVHGTQLRKVCSTGCSREHRLFETQTVDNFASLVLSGDLEGVASKVSYGCNYMKCALDCDIPTKIPPCGQEFKDLVDDLVSTMFTRLEDLLTSVGFIESYPPQCTALTTYHVPDQSVVPGEVGTPDRVGTNSGGNRKTAQPTAKTMKETSTSASTSASENTTLPSGAISHNGGLQTVVALVTFLVIRDFGA